MINEGSIIEVFWEEPMDELKTNVVSQFKYWPKSYLRDVSEFIDVEQVIELALLKAAMIVLYMNIISIMTVFNLLL